MPTSKEIFDVAKYAKVFSSLDLKSRYHQLPVRNGDKYKQHFEGLMNLERIDCINGILTNAHSSIHK